MSLFLYNVFRIRLDSIGQIFLSHAGIPVYIDAKHAIVHNKVMIIDRQIIVTRSFNFTKAVQEKNAENLLVVQQDKDPVEKCLDNYLFHRGHSESYRENVRQERKIN